MSLQSDLAGCTLDLGSTLSIAAQVLESHEARIVLITDQSGRLVGTLTDGDLRRSLLHGISMDEHVGKAMRREFYASRSGLQLADYERQMRQYGIRQLPILSEDGTLLDLILTDSLLVNDSIPCLPNSALLMAGGRGERLRPLTDDCPKPMLPLAGKPMLQIILEQLRESGIVSFYISVNYLRDHIIEYFGDGSRFGVSIDYLEEKDKLGTAGALSLMPQDSIQNPLLVMNGDVLTRVDPRRLLEYHADQGAYATMAVREHTLTVPFGVVETEGSRIVSLHEKPVYRYNINAGIYVLEPSVLSLLSPSECLDMPSLFDRISHAGHMTCAWPIHEYWIDVGRHDTLEQAGLYWELGSDR